MAELEEHAFRRDRGFVVRLILAVLLAGVAGAFVYGPLTGDQVGGCLAGSLIGASSSGPETKSSAGSATGH